MHDELLGEVRVCEYWRGDERSLERLEALELFVGPRARLRASAHHLIQRVCQLAKIGYERAIVIDGAQKTI